MGGRFGNLVTAGIRRLQPYLPGKPVEELERELGIHDSLKLASNENPLGPSPKGREAAQAVLQQVNLYPDDSGYRLRNALAYRLHVSPEALILGSGSSDVIDMFSRAFLAPGRNAVCARHAFAMYPIYTRAAGAEIRIADPLPPDDPQMPYGHDLAAMLELVDEDTRVVFIANPNNPTGTWLTEAQLRAFLDQLPGHVLVLLDEAYTEYVGRRDFPDGLHLLEDYPGLMLTRTFSKIYGLAGLRVGYGVADPELAAWVSRVRHPFNVSMPALAAAEAALDDSEFLDRSIALNHAGMEQLRQGFQSVGLGTIPSVGNFLCVDLDRDAAPVYQALLEQGVIVRPLANYDLPRHLRITIGSEQQNRRVLEVLERVL